MSDKTWPISIRYGWREQPSVDLDLEAYWDTHGFVLRDGGGDEHHFGLPDMTRSGVLFTWIASYTEDGREDWAGDVHDRLTALGYELAEPTRGPKLSPLVDVALEGLLEFAARKGFAFDEEREAAVRTFGALVRANEPFDVDEVYVYGATNGFRDPKNADRLREYAQRAISGKGTRTVNGRAIRVDGAQADKMIEYWRQKVAER